MATRAFLSRSPERLNRGPGGPASLGAGFLYHILCSTATAQSGAWEPSLLGAGCWLSLPHLVSNWLNFLCTALYNSSTATFFLRASQIALIQPVHGQGYILIFLDRMQMLFTQVHFLFWQPGRVGGQYTTVQPINKNIPIRVSAYYPPTREDQAFLRASECRVSYIFYEYFKKIELICSTVVPLYHKFEENHETQSWSQSIFVVCNE